MVIENWKKSGIATKFPTYRDSDFITTHSWLKGKRVDDEAEGLWRIYDGIFDFTDFIDKHPGGSFWIRETKGTDITEAFEAHHFSSAPFKMIEKYRVRDAAKPRIYTLTLHENGFYKTLKGRVREKLKTLDNRPKARSEQIHVGLLFAIFVFAIASVKFQSLLCMALSGLALCWTVIVAHNYFHRKDNWQMYTFNLSMLNVYSWRVSHAMSHHIFPNSMMDLELAMFEPLLCWVPDPHFKSKTMRYVSWVTQPLAYVLAFPLEMVKRILYSIQKTNIMYWNDLLCLTLPLSMYLFTSAELAECIWRWLAIVMFASFVFCAIALNAAHHDPEIYHDGDANREDRDWGLFQVDTIIDRSDLKGSHFLVLTHFGEHILHHLFPTLDHGILGELTPILRETLEEFNGELRECSYLHHVQGQHMQLLRTTPNPKPPGAK